MKDFNVDDFRGAPLPAEGEIMASWEGTNPLVSVVCTTYNHKNYIEDAIRGFLIQKTDFPFEVIIHDDASTDGTDLIVRKYVEEYPTLIRLISQTENQYSKGKRVIPLAAKHAVGEYLALCEGDDFWVSPEKLSKQISSMKANSQCKISFHRALMGGGQLSGRPISSSKLDWLTYPSKTFVFPAKNVILGDGVFMPTPSIIVRKECLDSLPEWFDETPVGDYFIQVLSSMPAGALYLPDAMCFYRTQSSGSWTKTMKSNPTMRLKFFDSYMSAMRKLGSAIDKRYVDKIEKMIFIRFCHLLLDLNIPVEDVRARAELVGKECAGNGQRSFAFLLSFSIAARVGALARIVIFRATRALSSRLMFLSERNDA
ncbi:glycosyltransferase family 2 protein [Metapseudomonas furukawaii]|uniref:glycosyltransferase family 2 protein n=1 Tax=Metapseudomonas furukawaii TaxID=1149133 RepID=UPI00103E28D1|nr:glycosyltransferase family A protein [Pseudomonas furukawaii]